MPTHCILQSTQVLERNHVGAWNIQKTAVDVGQESALSNYNTQLQPPRAELQYLG